MGDAITYDARVYQTEVYRGRQVTTYWVRWKVGGRLCKEAFRTVAQVSAPLENEAIAPLENEATQTDWLGDLCGGLGADPAAGGGRGAAAAGRASAGYRQVNGGAGGRVGGAAEV